MEKRRDGSHAIAVECEFSERGKLCVLQRLRELVRLYIPNSAGAVDALLESKHISRVYTYLPRDMSAALRHTLLDHEHASWGGDYYENAHLAKYENIIYVPMAWRCISQERLIQVIGDFLDRSEDHLCVLGAYDYDAILNSTEGVSDTYRLGPLLCVKKKALLDPMSMVLDSRILDTFGFLSSYSGETGALNAPSQGVARYMDRQPDEIIQTSRHIFLEVHEGENICIIDMV